MTPGPQFLAIQPGMMLPKVNKSCPQRAVVTLRNTQDHPGFAGGRHASFLHGLCAILLDWRKAHEHSFQLIISVLFKRVILPSRFKPSGLACWRSCLHSLLLLTERNRKAGLSRSAWQPLNLEKATGCCLQLWPVHWTDSASKPTRCRTTGRCLLSWGRWEHHQAQTAGIP